MDAPVCWSPDRLASVCPDRPAPKAPCLWVSGDLAGLSRRTVGIVGTRAATAYGAALAHRFAAEIAAAGCCIISGLALGIDAAAHEGALAAAGLTIGVLGCGHRVFFPRRNLPLAVRMITAGGAVVSPFPPDQPAHRGQFLQRNGVIADLCDALLVIEAPERSGALNTAGWAAGRIPVFAVPGDVDRAHVAGCHALIRDGAILARNPQDVLSEIGITQTSSSGAPRRHVAAPSTAMDQAVLRVLSQGETGVDTLAQRLGVPAPQLLSTLALLEIRGAIEPRGGLRYALR
ncbi:MAG TPA: DNA-processing protein DprA [Candidatus Baltobacteraceae bacterium]|nr:DNA-processing protein DprA [Candidatus Baltobacteraceae bacterium]